MCGICGEINFFKKDIKIESIKRMGSVLAHRGPDDEGMVFFKDGRPVEARSLRASIESDSQFEVGLGHRRLSIIDLSDAAHQPMCNEDKTVWIVYNGEIYNFREIRKELEKKGHIFKSNSDTEVIVHAYEEWGVDCLKAFRGMFAFGIWDSRQKRLFLARDRLGKKPLVYYFRNGRFIFASEIKALLQAPDILKRVNNTAIHHYLTYQYIPSPETIFEGINKLPPAHYLLYDSKGDIKIERYSRLNYNSQEKRKDDVETLCEIIRDKLKNR